MVKKLGIKLKWLCGGVAKNPGVVKALKKHCIPRCNYQKNPDNRPWGLHCLFRNVVIEQVHKKINIEKEFPLLSFSILFNNFLRE